MLQLCGVKQTYIIYIYAKDLPFAHNREEEEKKKNCCFGAGGFETFFLICLEKVNA